MNAAPPTDNSNAVAPMPTCYYIPTAPPWAEQPPVHHITVTSLSSDPEVCFADRPDSFEAVLNESKPK